MSELYGSDAYAPAEVALRIIGGRGQSESGYAAPANAWRFSGCLHWTGRHVFYTGQVGPLAWPGHRRGAGGGLVFSLGLLLVVAGAELFTGNNLLSMAWAGGMINTAQVLRNWVLVCLTNFVGAAGLAVLVFISGHTDLNAGAIG